MEVGIKKSDTEEHSFGMYFMINLQNDLLFKLCACFPLIKTNFTLKRDGIRCQEAKGVLAPTLLPLC
jgi:hypothetical protein